MRIAFPLLAAVAFVSGLGAQSSTTPSYSTAGIVNSATFTPDALAPNAIASIYGTNLSFDTRAVSSADIVNGMLPRVLAGVRVFIDNTAIPLYYVSPKQINFLVPSDLLLGDTDLFVAREATTASGGHVRITLHEVGPGLYQSEPGIIASTHANGSLITKDLPAQGGETVVLYGTGFGPTDPEVVSGQVTMAPAQIQMRGNLRVLVAGTALDTKSVQYAGLTPGSAGLYQLNVKLPQHPAPDPEIRVAIGGYLSPAGTKLPLH